MSSEWTQRPIDAPVGNLFDATEVAKLLGVSRDTFDGLVKAGEFPMALTIGSSTKAWSWRDVAWYVMKLELAFRFDPKSSDSVRNRPKASETGS